MKVKVYVRGANDVNYTYAEVEEGDEEVGKKTRKRRQRRK